MHHAHICIFFIDLIFCLDTCCEGDVGLNDISFKITFNIFNTEIPMEL